MALEFSSKVNEGRRAGAAENLPAAPAQPRALEEESSSSSSLRSF
jgi:hypothetical protein